MPVQSNPVPEAMCEVLVVRAVARRRNHTTRRVIHCSGQPSFARRIKRRILRSADDFVCLLNLLRRLAVNPRARHVRGVAFHLAAAVNQDHIAFTQTLRLDRTVGQGRGCPSKH
jgi:hypothetical protein